MKKTLWIKNGFRAVISKRIFRVWLAHSANLLWGTLAYNAFALFVLEPILRKFLPPLSGWEHVKRIVTGTSRYTYGDVLPYVGPTIWILGNGFLFALLNRNLLEAQESVRREEKKKHSEDRRT